MVFARFWIRNRFLKRRHVALVLSTAPKSLFAMEKAAAVALFPKWRYVQRVAAAQMETLANPLRKLVFEKSG